MPPTMTHESEIAIAIWLLRHNRMNTFWPACIYNSYTDALAHGHDISSLRDRQPVLLADEIVVYFLGVGPNGCFAQKEVEAPNLQLIVAPYTEVVYHPWGPLEAFESHCQASGLDDRLIQRASESLCFKQAMQEAEELRKLSSLAQIQTFFVSLLQSVSGKEEQPGVQSKNEFSTNEEKRKDGRAPSQSIAKSDPKQTILDIFRSNTDVTAHIWQHLLKNDWSTVTQKNGIVYYKSPITTFSNIKPNENIFESIENACQSAIYQELASFFANNKNKSPNTDPNPVVSYLLDHIWDQMEAVGWTTMQATNEIWYVKPDTSFMDCVPNVTMFDSKLSACCEYLGFVDSSVPQKKTEKKKSSGDPGVAKTSKKSFVVATTSLESNNPPNKEALKPVHPKKRMKKDCDLIEEPSLEGTSRKTKKTSAPKTTADEVNTPEPVKPIAPAYTRPRGRSIPPFKLTFGKIEDELRARGWTWKFHSLGWAYYMPHCNSMNKKQLVAGKDYFLGSYDLEQFLEFSGLKDDIELKLRTEHVKLYTSMDDPDNTPKKSCKKARKTETRIESNGDDVLVEAEVGNSEKIDILEEDEECFDSDATQKDTGKQHWKRAQRKARSTKNAAQATPKKRRCESECSTPPFSSFDNSSGINGGSRTRNCLTIQKSGADKKIFERTVWPKLTSQGWRVRPGKFGHDYFKPSYIEKSELIPNFNVFHSEFDLIEYLKESDQWDVLCEGDVKQVFSKTKTSTRVKAIQPLVAADNRTEYPSSQESDVSTASGNITEEDELTQICPIVESREYTPTHTNRSAFEISPNLEGRQSQATESSYSFTKDTSESTQPNTPLHSLSRNLASTFTPSPKPKTLIDHARAALCALQSTHVPSRFHAREKEKKEIMSMLQHALALNQGSSLYISGAPGCGKSALVDHTISEYVKELDNGAKLEPLKLNALSLQNGSALLLAIAGKLLKKPFDDAATAFEMISQVTNKDSKNQKVGLLVLDEVDAMIKKGEIDEDLQRLLSLVYSSAHTFIFIGIANRVDLTERFWCDFSARNQNLANSASHSFTQTKVIIFEPYTFESIQTILTERLGGRAITDQLLSRHGISFLARKIAAGSGDIRIALDVTYRILQRKMDCLSSDVGYGEAVPLNDMLREIKRALESKDILAMQSLPRSMQLVLYAVFCLHRDVCDTNDKASFSVDQAFAKFNEIMEKCGDVSKMSHEKFHTIMDQLSLQGLLAGSDLKKRQQVRLLSSLHDVEQFFEKENFFGKYLSRK
uniref:Uncharacterized protein AlNc14C77G5144 n=1 Tax=Albugo laibachii Nc14 TaxID=890382 RepID=F0WEU4_9STRA|nr:conserved hypothetical protein [Albugo laibachii Nc14]|eukprot:CCA19726.1 conserved hypothetical protein [Albugo laibachii Nc14]